MIKCIKDTSPTKGNTGVFVTQEDLIAVVGKQRAGLRGWGGDNGRGKGRRKRKREGERERAGED